MACSRRELFAAGLVGSAGLWSGCGGGDDEQEKRPLQVSAGPYLAMSSLYLGLERGYFREAGLDVELRQVPGSSQALPLLARGRIDVAFTALNPSLVNAVIKGARIRIVAGREILAPACPDAIIAYGSAATFPDGLTDARQLRGKRVSVTRSSTFGLFMLDHLLRGAGLSLDDVKLARLRRSEAIAGLMSGQIDATSGSDLRFSHVLESDKIVRGIPLAEVLPEFQYSFVLFGKRLLQGDSRAGARFLSAYLRAGRDFLRGETPEFMNEYSASNHLDAEAVRTACRDTFRADGEIQMEDIQETIDWFDEQHMIEDRLTAARITDTRFLRLAREEARK